MLSPKKYARASTHKPPWDQPRSSSCSTPLFLPTSAALRASLHGSRRCRSHRHHQFPCQWARSHAGASAHGEPEPSPQEVERQQLRWLCTAPGPNSARTASHSFPLQSQQAQRKRRLKKRDTSLVNEIPNNLKDLEQLPESDTGWETHTHTRTHARSLFTAKITRL